MDRRDKMPEDQRKQVRRMRSENTFLDILFLFGDIILYIPRLIAYMIRSFW